MEYLKVGLYNKLYSKPFRIIKINCFLLKKQILLIFVSVVLIFLGVDLYKRNIANRTFDIGCASTSYGLAQHFDPEKGPYFGKHRGDNDRDIIIDSVAFAKSENMIGTKDNDGFPRVNKNEVININSEPDFAPEIIAEKQSYSISIPINAAEAGDPVRGWIDFNGNGIFEEDEKAAGEYISGATVNLTWRLPLILNPSLTYLRIRTCERTFVENIESPSRSVKTGEVEDYVVRITKTITPQADLKESIDFLPFAGKNGIKDVAPIINNLMIGKNNISIKISGTTPEIIGINNLQEPSLTGLLIGHNSNTALTNNNPIVLTLKASALLENVNFQLLDIDGGDKIKIQGYRKGEVVAPSINNLIDNFYYQFNNITSEVYSNMHTNAGADSMMASCLSMSVNVNFSGFIDSVKLTYTDTSPSSTGTFTIGNFSARKYNIPETNIEQFTTYEIEETQILYWKISKNNRLLSYFVERSYDNVTYETIGSKFIKNTKDSLFSFVDKDISPAINYCFYRIKTMTDDNHVSFSQTYRIKRNESTTTSGFITEKFNFNSEINVILLKDMTGQIKVNLYDYKGGNYGNWNFENKKAKDVLLLNNLSNIPENMYYIQIINNTNKYNLEVNKVINSSNSN